MFICNFTYFCNHVSITKRIRAKSNNTFLKRTITWVQESLSLPIMVRVYSFKTKCGPCSLFALLGAKKLPKWMPFSNSTPKNCAGCKIAAKSEKLQNFPFCPVCPFLVRHHGTGRLSSNFRGTNYFGLHLMQIKEK